MLRMYRCAECFQVEHSRICTNCGSSRMIDVTSIVGEYESLKTERQKKDEKAKTGHNQKSV
jgi:rRNA maturation endonuclease Nob1